MAKKEISFTRFCNDQLKRIRAKLEVPGPSEKWMSTEEARLREEMAYEIQFGDPGFSRAKQRTLAQLDGDEPFE